LKKAEWNGLEILACAAGIYYICSRRFNLICFQHRLLGRTDRPVGNLSC
jgi:hypothetical protein